ncbi:MAG: hypothetical protein D8M58_11315 [Calditrichaeota bacterium]|nr:MAG: hypothetical protein DWQ03_10690 [Calditrichota bacterium]MBL1205982.1 hypothetical protein [Calditrichota bacterium]NOG45810.1 hypothetical protein [Calditrichota bacterium]
MSNPIKKIILGKYLSFRLKMLLSQERAYDFSSELNKVKKALVILPAQNEYSEPFQVFVKKLNTVFPNANISTFVSSSLRKTDMSWLGVPNEQYLKIIRDEQFDLVIDANDEQDKICSYLCALSGAPMRLNLASGEYDSIYNLHFRTAADKKMDDRLVNIVSYFEHLKK